MLQTLSLVTQLLSLRSVLEEILQSDSFNSIITISPEASSSTSSILEEISSISSAAEIPILHVKAKEESVGGGNPPLKFRMNSQLFAVLVLTSNDDYDIVISAASKLLNFNRMTKVLVTGFPAILAATNLTQLFDRCWKLNFINVIVGPTSYGSIHSYNHFPTFQIHNKTTSQINGNYFTDKFRNINGCPIRVATLSSPPRSFVYGDTKYGGYLLNSLATFAKRVNGTLITVQLTPYEGVKAVYAGKIDFVSTFLPFKGFDQNKTDTFEYWDMSIIVPIAKRIPIYMYITMPFDLWTWLLVLVGIIYITLVVHTMIRSTTSSLDVWKIFTFSLRATLYQSFEQLKCKNSSQKTILLLVIFFGFIVTTIYNTFLGSFLTTTIPGPQINRFSDLGKAHVKIMCIHEEFEMMKSIDARFVDKYSKFFTPTDFNSVMQHRDKLNGSYGYVTPQDKWEYYFNQIQIFHNRYTFRVMNEHVLKVALALPIHENSIFKHAVNKHIHQMRETGVFFKWCKDALFEMMEAGLVDDIVYLPDEGRAQPLPPYFFRFVWMGILLGELFALLVFIGELLWHWNCERLFYNSLPIFLYLE